MRSHNQTKLIRAAQHQQAGEIAQAEALCRQIVQGDPYDAVAWNLLGIVSSQGGKTATALECFDRARVAAPANADYRSNRAMMLHALGRQQEAEEEYRQALRLNPKLVEAHYNLGTILGGVGRFAESEACFRQALKLRPTYAEAHNNLGTTLRELGRLAESAACCRRALELKPDFVDAHANLGNVLRELGRLEESVACSQRALDLQPSHAEANNNRGTALVALDRLEEAVACLQRALELNPALPSAHHNLGTALWRLGRFAESEPCFRRALELKPGHAEAHNNLAHLLLARGDYEQGWAEFEWRWHIKEFALPAHSQPLWDGSSLAGRTILLHPEQGYGDAIQFVRYAALIHERGATVLLHCHMPLLGILRTCPGIDRLVAEDGVLPPFDVYAPLLSLPRLCGTRIDNIPARAPYLTANPALVNDWRKRLASTPGFKVGIVWQGSTDHKGDRRRSVPLTAFTPLAEVPGVTLLSLQVGHGQEQLATPIHRFAITDLGSHFDPATFDDAAAVLENVDLVITVDTALAHLAGAMGKAAWVAIPFSPDWRWLLERESSPWYPTMRLFRQRRPDDWNDVFARMAQELARLSTASAELMRRE